MYVAIGVASVSLEPDAAAVTGSGVCPEEGVTVSRATGALSAGAPFARKASAVVTYVTWIDVVSLGDSPGPTCSTVLEPTSGLFGLFVMPWKRSVQPDGGVNDHTPTGTPRAWYPMIERSFAPTPLSVGEAIVVT